MQLVAAELGAPAGDRRPFVTVKLWCGVAVDKSVELGQVDILRLTLIHYYCYYCYYYHYYLIMAITRLTIVVIVIFIIIISQVVQLYVQHEAPRHRDFLQLAGFGKLRRLEQRKLVIQECICIDIYIYIYRERYNICIEIYTLRHIS